MISKNPSPSSLLFNALKRTGTRLPRRSVLNPDFARQQNLYQLPWCFACCRVAGSAAGFGPPHEYRDSVKSTFRPHHRHCNAFCRHRFPVLSPVVRNGQQHACRSIPPAFPVSTSASIFVLCHGMSPRARHKFRSTSSNAVSRCCLTAFLHHLRFADLQRGSTEVNTPLPAALVSSGAFVLAIQPSCFVDAKPVG